ncbi:MAG: hypothetical protein L0Z62_21320 [Gemmataceae bacterium]|nr:hypothetical protein [Gemmataceae bacterium]
MRILVAGVCALVAVLLLSAGDDSRAGEKKKDPKYTISEVMLKAQKSGLWKKVATGNGDADEKKQLVEYYTALAQHKPPAGDEAAWKKQTATMLKFAKSIAEGDEKAGKLLQKTVSCTKCHAAFKE